MYLQITTRCNMTCAHCCYSCTKKGDDMSWETVIDATAFILDYSECITIGGGEPTLHPRFWDILKRCTENFDSTWFATNGSQTETMKKLWQVLMWGEYRPEDMLSEIDISEKEDPDGYWEAMDRLYDKHGFMIHEGHYLTVALSTDRFHDPIDEWVLTHWREEARKKNHRFELRDVTTGMDGVAAQGRAKKNNVGWGTQCVCADQIIKPDGSIRLCGCTGAPTIGHIRTGIEEAYMDLINSDKFRNRNCYRDVKREISRIKKTGEYKRASNY